MSPPIRAPRILSLLALAMSLTACTARRGDPSASVLLFNGAGTSREDVAALEDLLDQNHVPFATADSAGLNEMDAAQLRQKRLLVIPGGNFEKMGNNLSAAASANIRRAVEA